MTREPEPERRDASTNGSVFLRIPMSERTRRGRIVACLLELDSEGYIPREIDVIEGDVPVRVTRPGEYGQWNDAPMPRVAPGTPEFRERWRGAVEISTAEFEGIYQLADRTLR